jgi:hypothetical protein
MTFDIQYDNFMKEHLQNRLGESLRRLQEGHGHAEKLFLEQVWWPAIGHFKHLSPEYEVNDFKDGYRYLDFAYIRQPFQVCIEIDGYGPHSRDTSRWHFADNLIRQNHLTIDGWKVIRFAYDDIKEKPRRCQQLIQQLMGRWFGDEQVPVALGIKHKEIVRLIIHKQKPVSPLEVCAQLSISDRHARTLLHELVQADVLVAAAGGTQRVRSYQLNPLGNPIYI